MDKVFIRFSLILVMLLSFGFGLQAQDLKAGKDLFKSQCATCHAKNMKDKSTGPALGGAEERWAEFPREDLYSWVRNSAGLIAAGHPRANAVWNEFNKAVMTPFPNLKDEEIENVLAYVDAVYTGSIGGAPKTDAAGTVAPEAVGVSNWVYYGLFAALLVLAGVLWTLIRSLNVFQADQEGRPFTQKSYREILTSKGVIAAIIVLLVIVGGYSMVTKAVGLNRQQNYQPDQPIKFSHVTHAGVNKIDCQYCHDGARRSKHSVIPATNTCMNCHKAVKKGSTYGTGEITKIYASIGYNPSTDKYIENYDQLSVEEIKEIYTTWIADSYREDNDGSLDARGKLLVNNQWNDIVSSLTNDVKTKIQGPIPWVKIHNLPDHVFFSHEQHVSVGKLECQQCHGPVEEMEVMKQYATLSMGWCINCHRETEVEFTDNAYYQSYQHYHEEIKAGTRDKVTVADIGGLECQKCHY